MFEIEFLGEEPFLLSRAISGPFTCPVHNAHKVLGIHKKSSTPTPDDTDQELVVERAAHKLQKSGKIEWPFLVYVRIDDMLCFYLCLADVAARCVAIVTYDTHVEDPESLHVARLELDEDVLMSHVKLDSPLAKAVDAEKIRRGGLAAGGKNAGSYSDNHQASFFGGVACGDVRAVVGGSVEAFAEFCQMH